MNKNKLYIALSTSVLVVFFSFWMILSSKGLAGNTDTAEIFSALYGIMALVGGLIGLAVSRHWGGFKSKIGRAVAFMSLGLLSQELGQLIYSMYTFLLDKEIPYPSFGDVGYFGSVILYGLAAYSLVTALSTKTTRSTVSNKIAVIGVPLALLSFSAVVFLNGYHVDSHHLLTVFLDFGYPLGQAFYLSLGLLALIVSKRYLGGFMKPVILFFIFALLLQYAADFVFLYQTSRDTWQTAGINELMYLVSYYIMTLNLIEFGRVLDRFSPPKKVDE